MMAATWTVPWEVMGSRRLALFGMLACACAARAAAPPAAATARRPGTPRARVAAADADAPAGDDAEPRAAAARAARELLGTSHAARAGVNPLLEAVAARAASSLARGARGGRAPADSGAGAPITVDVVDAVDAPAAAESAVGAADGAARDASDRTVGAPLLDALERLEGTQALARGVWAAAVRAGDLVVDATCGNGRDAAALASVLADASARAEAGARTPAPRGRLVCVDIQPRAADATREAVREALEGARAPPAVEVAVRSHERLPRSVADGTARLVVYNLGYLPGGDHSIVTRPETTVASLRAAQRALAVGGAITVMVYPAHAGGREEAEAVLAQLGGLDRAAWRVIAHRPLQNADEKFLVTALRRR